MTIAASWQVLAASLADLELRLRVVGWSIDPDGASDAFVALGRAADQSAEHLDAVLSECARTDCLPLITLPGCASLSVLPGPERAMTRPADALDHVAAAAEVMAGLLEACAVEHANASSGALCRDLAGEVRLQSSLVRSIARGARRKGDAE